MTGTIVTNIMRVRKVYGGFQVEAYLTQPTAQWAAISKVYGHSTSAFAKLGRLYTKAVEEQA